MTFQSDTITERRLNSVPLVSDTQLAYRRYYKWALVASDTLMLAVAFLLAYWLRFHMQVALVPEVVPSPELYIRLVVILIPLWLPLFSLMRLYDFHFLLGGTAEYARVFNACSSGMMIVIIVSFFEPSFVVARGWLIMSWLLSSVLVAGARFTMRRYIYARWRDNQLLTPTLIVGTNPEATALGAQLRRSHMSGLALLGYVTEESTPFHAPTHLDGLPMLGGVSSLADLIRERAVGQIIVASTAVTREQLFHVFEQVAGAPEVEIQLSSGVYEILTTDMHVTYKGNVPLMNLSRLRLDPIEKILKLMLDYTLILLTLPLLLPLFALIAVWIKLDSPGPVFFRRQVMGTGGHVFNAYKFRTMAINGEEILAQYPELAAKLARDHKLKDDPRVTRVGQILRRYSLDELPQLINVLLGQMSLVGPRMISLDETKEYGQMAMNLFTVKPGLTGLWQVSGRSDLSYVERVRLDMDYIRNYTIWLDMQILFIQTPPVVLKGRGAY